MEYLLIRKDIKKFDNRTKEIIEAMLHSLVTGEVWGERVSGKLMHLYKIRCHTSQSTSKSNGLRIWYILCGNYFQPILIESANDKGKELSTARHVEECIDRLKRWGEFEAYQQAAKTS